MRLAVGIAPFGQGVVFQHGQLVFRDAVFGFKIVLVVFVADVVNAPVFAVDEEYGRPVILCFHAKLFGQGLKQAVAKDGKVPVVAGIAEQETLEAVEVFVGKQLIIKFLRAVLRTHDDAEGFARATAGGVAVELDADIFFEGQLTVVFKKSEMRGPLPAVLKHVVEEARHIDADFRIEEVFVVGAE